MTSSYGVPLQRARTYQQNAGAQDPYHVPGYIPPNTQGGYNGPVYGSAAGTYLPYSNKATYDPYQELGAAAENPDYYKATGGALQAGNSVAPGTQRAPGGSLAQTNAPAGNAPAGNAPAAAAPSNGGVAPKAQRKQDGGRGGRSSSGSSGGGGGSFAPSSVPKGYDPNILGAKWNPAPGGGYVQRSNGAVVTSAGDGGSFDAYNPGRFRGQGNVDPQSGGSAGSGYSGFGQDKYVGSEQFYSSDAVAYRTGNGANAADRTYNMEGTAPRKQINEEYSYRGTSADAYNGGGGERGAGAREWGYMDELGGGSRQEGTHPGYRQDYGRLAAQPAGGSPPPERDGRDPHRRPAPTGQRMAGQALAGLGV